MRIPTTPSLEAQQFHDTNLSTQISSSRPRNGSSKRLKPKILQEAFNAFLARRSDVGMRMRVPKMKVRDMVARKIRGNTKHQREANRLTSIRLNRYKVIRRICRLLLTVVNLIKETPFRNTNTPLSSLFQDISTKGSGKHNETRLQNFMCYSRYHARNRAIRTGTVLPLDMQSHTHAHVQYRQ